MGYNAPNRPIIVAR